MNNKLYSAAHGRMRSLALESLARLEAKLNSVDPNRLDREIVDSIIKDAQDLAQLEGALLTMQQYFNPAPPEPELGPPEEPMVVTPEISPTYKKSIEENE